MKKCYDAYFGKSCVYDKKELVLAKSFRKKPEKSKYIS